MDRLTALAVALLALALAAPALAASVRVDPESAALYRGQTLTLRYTVFGVDEPPPAPKLDPAGATVDYMGLSQSSSVRIINGRQTSSFSFTYSYALTPHRVGTITVAPARFRLRSGEELTSRTVSVVVTDAPVSDDFRLRVEASEDELYVGQPVRLTWTWLAGREFEGAELDWPAPAEADVFVPRESDPDVHPRKSAATLLGEPVALTQQRMREDDRTWNAFTAELVVVPRAPGTLVIPGAATITEARTGRNRPGLTRLSSRFETEIVRAAADPIQIPVKPLPDAGRPSDFTGLVGRFNVQTAAEPTSVRVGDPIEMNIIVRGPEPLSAVPDLDLASDPRFAARFRVDGQERGPTRGRDAAIFKRTLRAVDDSVDAIPPVELPYFDPELGRYAVARSAPIELSVAPTRVVTLADAQGDVPRDAPARTIESRQGGLAANATSLSALDPDAASLRSLALAPASIALLAAPPLACAIAGVAALARTRRDRAGAAASRRRALPETRAALDEARTPDDVHQALSLYLRRRWPEADPPPTLERLADRLRDREPALAVQIDEVRAAADAARFGGASVDATDLARQASAALDALERLPQETLS